MKLADNKNRGFISTFVSELYAILIGIGITSVIFELAIELDSWLKFVMAIFVTIIVTLYWWDWAAFVNSYFVASSSEFVIDFVTLVTLECLFANYSDAQKLSINFLALGILDFVWVINYFSITGKKISLRNEWIQQKIAAILLYGISVAIITKYFGKLPLELLFLIIITTCILVRVFCFKGVKKETSINLRAANEEDINSILAINHHYANKHLKDKFLLQKFSDSYLLQLINDNSKKIFVSHGKSKTLAYAIVSYGISSDLLNDIQWLDPLLASEVEQNDCLYIDQIAVNPHCLRKNIGREFYEKLIKQSASPTICAFVALEPRCNRTSLKFHESLGFRKAALFQRDEFKGDGFETIENYKSLLLVRH